MNRCLTIAIAATLGAAFSLAGAQSTPGSDARIDAPLPGYTGAQLRQAQDDVARLDRDRSGELEPAEVGEIADLAQRFEDYDVDDTGSISLNEYQSWLAAQGSRSDANDYIAEHYERLL
jgi:hypothetical protein